VNDDDSLPADVPGGDSIGRAETAPCPVPEGDAALTVPAPKAPPVALQPLAYQQDIVAYLQETEPELWQWASSVRGRDEFAASIRTEMLKTHYRLDAEGHPDLAERCARVAACLGVTVPVTLYQAAGSVGLNAMLYHSPGEAHIVFSGPILSILQGPELDAVLAHELAHHRLWEMQNGDFLVADRLLLAAANDPRATPSHAQTARRFRLYTEVFADRGALAGCGDLEVAVAALVKTETGLPQVSATSYLRQADEIFSRENATTRGLDHPETYIRARALQLWAAGDPALPDWLSATIEGPLALDSLDLPGQRRATDLTRRFLAELLLPAWFQTTTVLAHARAFFPDFTPARKPDETLVAALRSEDDATREYFCYLLLDFATVDRELEDVPLAAAWQWGERLGINNRLEKLITRELGLGKRQLHKITKDAAAMLAKAEGKA